VYQFTQFPHIDSLSFSTSGLVGGQVRNLRAVELRTVFDRDISPPPFAVQELVIRGTGFSWDAGKNTVDLAGTPCVVTAATDSELRCKVGTATASTPFNVSSGVSYASGRGLLRRFYRSTNGIANYNNLFYSNDEFPVTPAATSVVTTGLLGMESGENLVAQVSTRVR